MLKLEEEHILSLPEQIERTEKVTEGPRDMRDLLVCLKNGEFITGDNAVRIMDEADLTLDDLSFLAASCKLLRFHDDVHVQQYDRIRRAALRKIRTGQLELLNFPA